MKAHLKRQDEGKFHAFDAATLRMCILCNPMTQFLQVGAHMKRGTMCLAHEGTFEDPPTSHALGAAVATLCSVQPLIAHLIGISLV